MAVDVDSLAGPISAEQPSGPNLEYDREFGLLERAAVGTPEKQVGENILPAQEPDWKVLVKQATAVLERSRDLRVASHLTKALLRTAGLAGFADGLALTRALVDRHWDTVHPQLDPDDGNDPTMRVNTLAGLADDATMAALRATPLVDARGVGRFGLREIAIATGEAPAQPDQPKPDPSAIDAAFTAVDLEALSATAAAVRGAADHITAIETAVTERVGAARAPNLGRLSGLLQQAGKYVGAALERRGAAAPASNGAAEGSAAAQGGAMPGQINSRDDVVRAIDQICAYYQRHEPSSPVPLLLKRAKRLATMSFVQIMKDMAPDAMSQIENIGGRSDSGESS
jgi:type VI secretion system protein ImpA